MCARYVQYKRYQVIRVALCVKIVAMHQSFKVKESVQESSLVLLNDVLMLETKGQSKQQAMVIVSYVMLRVQQLYTCNG